MLMQLYSTLMVSSNHKATIKVNVFETFIKMSFIFQATGFKH